jgi:hypothetical protein
MSKEFKILNAEQASAVYSAMVYLNNVGGRLNAEMPGHLRHVTIRVRDDGDSVVVSVNSGGAVRSFQKFASQNEFAAFYGVA